MLQGGPVFTSSVQCMSIFKFACYESGAILDICGIPAAFKPGVQSLPVAHGLLLIS